MITNKKVIVHLDNEKRTLWLSEVLTGTMIFLYDSQGKLVGKYKFESQPLVLAVPGYGTYVLVMSHPSCQPEVRRIIYSEI